MSKKDVNLSYTLSYAGDKLTGIRFTDEVGKQYPVEIKPSQGRLICLCDESSREYSNAENETATQFLDCVHIKQARSILFAIWRNQKTN